MRFVLRKSLDCKWQHQNFIGDRIWLLHGVRCAMVNRREGRTVQPVENAEIGQNHNARCRGQAGMQPDGI